MYQLDYVKMGARIRQFRKAKGWSQGKLAKKCGISLNFMGNIERGTRRMSMDTFAGLCNALGTDADTLLFGIAKHAETPVRRMWGQADQDGEDKKAVKNGKDQTRENNESLDKEDAAYAIYVQIMRAVADILQGGDPSKGRKKL